MKVPACCRSLDDSLTCEHKQRYIEAVAFIRAQGYSVGYAPDGARATAWKAARCSISCKAIDIWPTAYEHYGWDGVTSSLIHEFGHFKLYEAEGLYDASIATEQKANEYGARSMPRALIPENYGEYRAFFLQSYKNPTAFATGKQVLEAFERWKE